MSRSVCHVTIYHMTVVIVTEKHWEEVSTDASDEEMSTTKQMAAIKTPTGGGGGGGSKKGKGMQASLMSFFGK